MQSGRNAAAILDALGDPTRRLIYERLWRRPSNVTVLAEGIPVTRSAVSRHLQVLKGCGLVEARNEGASQIYTVCRDGLAPLTPWMARVKRAGG